MKKNKQKVLERIRTRIRPDEKEFIKMNLSISRQITSILESKGWSQKELAKRLNKKESEISRLLSGLHNISLKSIAKLKVILEEEIIVTPLEACDRYSTIKYVTLRIHARPNSAVKGSNYIEGTEKVTYKSYLIKKAS